MQGPVSISAVGGEAGWGTEGGQGGGTLSVKPKTSPAKLDLSTKAEYEPTHFRTAGSENYT